MIAITSISPNHANHEAQKTAIQSWIAVGFKVVSLNPPHEIEALKDQFPEVEIISTNRISQEFKKQTVVISAMIDFAKSFNSDHFLIINSDIIIHDTRDTTRNLLLKSERGLVVLSRYDFDGNYDKSVKYNLGFDGFLIHKKWLPSFPDTSLCIGQCFWDYWLPYVAILKRIPLFKLGTHYIFHKRHKIQYDDAEYQTAAEIFRREISPIDKSFNPTALVEHMSAHVFNKIRRA